MNEHFKVLEMYILIKLAHQLKDSIYKNLNVNYCNILMTLYKSNCEEMLQLCIKRIKFFPPNYS